MEKERVELGLPETLKFYHRGSYIEIVRSYPGGHGVAGTPCVERSRHHISSSADDEEHRTIGHSAKMKTRRFFLYLVPMVVLLGLVFCIEHASHTLWPIKQWKNEPVHSTIEALGALAAIFMCMVLLQRKREAGGGKLFLVAMGFLSMGLLDGFHAISHPGQAFVFLHSMAGLAGGLGFVLVWSPDLGGYVSKGKLAPWVVGGVSVLVGIWVLSFPGTLPQMVHHGEFTPVAKAINFLAGGLFLIATLRFMFDFYHSGKIESYLFACLALLFGISGIIFTYSALWDHSWWQWHILRLMAYSLVLGNLFRGYYLLLRELKESNERLELDIVERKRAEERLGENERKSLAWLEHSPVCTKIVDLDFNLQFMSRSGVEGLGVDDITPFYGKPYPFDFYPESFRSLMSKNLEKARDTGEVIAQEGSVVDIDGNELWFHSTLVPVNDEEGRIDYIMVISADITERKRTELELRDHEVRIKAVLDVAVDGIFTVHQNDAIESANPGGYHMFGYPDGELIGRDIRTLIPEVYGSLKGAGRERNPQTAMNALAPTFRELVGRRRDGTNFPIEVTLRDICTEEETLTVTFVRDISERKQIEEMRRSFFAIASHELRTPLNNMVLSLDMLARGEAGVLPIYLTDMIEVARRGGARLRRLIHDILDMQKIESGRIGFRMDVLDLSPLVEEAIKSTAAYAEQFRVRYVFEPGAIGIKIVADSDRFHQVLDNLLSNAARFSPTDGTVNIALSQEDGMVRVAVTDNGPGVPDEFRPLVFEPFAQAAPSLEDSRNKDSAGLGLSIAKAIVETLGGRIGFDSLPGVETTFYVLLPEWRGDPGEALN